MRQYSANIVDPQTQALVARAGTTRAILRREVVDDETWENSWIVNEGMRPIGIEYRLVGAHAVDARMESYIGLDRGAQEQPFGERDLLYVSSCSGARVSTASSRWRLASRGARPINTSSRCSRNSASTGASA